MQKIPETANVAFSPVSLSFVQDYLGMLNDPDVSMWLGSRSVKFTVESEIEWVGKKLAEESPVWSMIEKKSGEFIGNIELMDVDAQTAELGIVITANKQDKGYGSEAIKATLAYGFGVMGLEKIVLKVYPDNARAIHVYEKCGFREYDRNNDDVFMEVLKDGFAEGGGS